jgi:hypothetical protein
MWTGVHTVCVEVTQILFSAFPRRGMRATTILTMFRAIGVVIILWYVSHLFTQSFLSLDSALSESFETLEVAAVASRKHIE